MIWRDILIDNRPSDTELQRALASLFGIKPDEVGLFGDYSELLEPVPGTIRVLCERLPTDGEFRMKLGIMPIHPEQEAIVRGHDDLELLSTLCRLLNVRGLVDDGSPNPYAFLLLSGVETPSRVDLDADRLDLDDQYILLPQVAEVGD